jgi:hypothetical protein
MSRSGLWSNFLVGSLLHGLVLLLLLLLLLPCH